MCGRGGCRSHVLDGNLVANFERETREAELASLFSTPIPRLQGGPTAAVADNRLTAAGWTHGDQFSAVQQRQAALAPQRRLRGIAAAFGRILRGELLGLPPPCRRRSYPGQPGFRRHSPPSTEGAAM